METWEIAAISGGIAIVLIKVALIVWGIFHYPSEVFDDTPVSGWGTGESLASAPEHSTTSPPG